MPKLGRTKPCAGCPWLRKSLRGYLGNDKPIAFYRKAVTQEQLMPCHEQIDYDDPNWHKIQYPNVDLCAGNLIYFNNNAKRPRNPLLAKACDAVGKSRHIFAWPIEFFRHHMPNANFYAIERAERYAQWPYEQEGEDE